ncbi:MAG: hypothetical protein AAFX76_14165, partial [Planctomycetota bacterium]
QSAATTQPPPPTGMLIAWGRGTDRGGGRAGAMVACVAVVVLEPALWWLGWQSGGVGVVTMRLSPIQVMWALSSAWPEGEWAGVAAGQVGRVATTAAAAAAGWLVLGVLLGWQVRRSGRGRD